MTLNLFYALRLLSGADYSRVFEAERVQALARLYLSTRFEQYYDGLLFWGLASAVCGYLWFKFGLYPQSIGCLRFDLVWMGRGVYFRLPHFSHLQQGG